MSGQYQFKSVHLAHSCDLSAYESLENQITALFQEFQVYSQEVERKINISSEDLDPQSVFEEWVNRYEQVDDLFTKQRNLLKRVPQSQHLDTCVKSLATEFGGPMRKWSESFQDLQKYTQYTQIAELSKIREIVELDEEVKYYRSEFNKKIQEYENTASD